MVSSTFLPSLNKSIACPPIIPRTPAQVERISIAFKTLLTSTFSVLEAIVKASVNKPSPASSAFASPKAL